MTTEVSDNTSASRFELNAEKGTAFISYRQRGNVLSLDHTEVPDALAGQGVGSALVQGALNLVRERGQKIVASCSFVARFIEKHPQYRDLEAE